MTWQVLDRFFHEPMDETTCISRTVSGAAFGAATGANAAAAPRSRETMKSFMLPVCDFCVNIHAIDGSARWRGNARCVWKPPRRGRSYVRRAEGDKARRPNCRRDLPAPFASSLSMAWNCGVAPASGAYDAWQQWQRLEAFFRCDFARNRIECSHA